MLPQYVSKQAQKRNQSHKITEMHLKFSMKCCILCSSLCQNSCCKAFGEEKGFSPGSQMMHSYLRGEQQGVVYI